MKIQERYQRAVNEFVRRAVEKYKDKIDEIILFGSVARGEAEEDSDIDILVVVKERNIEDMKEIYGIAFEVSMEHSLGISPKVYGASEVLNRIEIGAPFITEVLKDGVPLYGEVRTGKIKNIEPKTHEGVLSMFGLHVIKESDVEGYYGKALRFAKEEREKSDYDALAEVNKEEAETIVEDAEKFLVRIKAAIKDILEERER